jgi:inner membrane protein
MVLHRAETHALFYLLLAAGAAGWLIARLHGETALWRRWWLAMWLVLVTHPLLDAMTVYGTQLLLPFTDNAFGVGSVFIIDPAYTLPLLVGVVLSTPCSGAWWPSRQRTTTRVTTACWTLVRPCAGLPTTVAPS